MQLARYIFNTFHIPFMLIRVINQLKRQKHFMQMELNPFLQKHLSTNDGSIDAEDIRKIEKYYGLAVPAILGEAFAQLRGMPLSHRERLAATFLGASTGLYDDLFDKKQLQEDYIDNMFHHTAAIKPQDSFEKMLMESWGKTQDLSASKELLAHYAIIIHKLQIQTKQQQTGHLSVDEVKKLTFNKGGYSVLLYMSLFYKNMPVADEKLYYNAGALLQLENDIFDVYKDSRAGIKTLVTHAEDIAKLRELYLQKWLEVKTSLAQTAHLNKGKKAFARILCAIVSRGFVCLDMLTERQRENNGKFNPHVFERKKLICDMEKPVNLLKTIHYYCTYN
jgi:hypothetical protein